MTAQELKNSILQLAIQGKLVKQDSNDEPASVLLEKIKEEREILIKEKKIKREKYSEIYKDPSDNHYYEKFEDGTIKDVTEEIPFDIPNNWKFSRLINIFNIVTGKKDANFGTEDGLYNFYTCSNTVYKAPSYSFDGEYLIMPGNGANVGQVTIYNGKFEAYQRTYVINQFANVLFLKYVYYNLMGYWNIYNKNKQFGSAIPYIKLGNIQDYILSIPPLEEQKKIVERIEVIIPLIEKYEKINSSIEKLNNTYKEELKKAILQYAIQGKLVNQDPNDEPAEVLINKILDEKRALIKTKQIKKENLSVIYKDPADNQFYEKFDDGTINNITEEIPFDIPNNWKWIRLSKLLSVKGGKRIPKGEKLVDNKTKHIYLRVTDMKNNTISDDKIKYIDDSVYEQINNYTISSDDLYLTIAGTIGNIGIIPEKYNNMNLTENAVKLCNISINKMILLYFLQSAYIQSIFNDKTNKVAQPKLAITRIETTLFPLPPVNEQLRIILKIEQLLNLIK